MHSETFTEVALIATFGGLALALALALALIVVSKAFASRRYRKAAESGSIEAQGSLGLRYAAGFGISQDHVAAFKWLTLAAERASGPDQALYANARDAVANELNPAQI